MEQNKNTDNGRIACNPSAGLRMQEDILACSEGGGFKDKAAGEQGKDALLVAFDRKLRLEFPGTKVTCDADAGECCD